jgi:thiamine biosynthesis lipoprotein
LARDSAKHLRVPQQSPLFQARPLYLLVRRVGAISLLESSDEITAEWPLRVAMSTVQCRITGLAFAALTMSAGPGPHSQANPQLSRQIAGRFTFSEAHMGTMFRIVLYAPDAATAEKASRAAFDRVAALDDTMSDYKPDSELTQLSRRAGGPPVKVSEDLFQVLAAAQVVALRSGGAFDVTVGPLVRLWRRARRRHELPDPNRLAQAEALVGYRNLVLDPKQRTAQLFKPGMMLDLGGIAKGYAADQALGVLKRRGITSALVAAAGDIVCSHPPTGRDNWRIEIATPAPSTQSADRSARYLLLHDAAVSTSGDAEQHLDVGGRRYSHIINPVTGMALTGQRSVTVVAAKGITADSYAVAVCVLGPQRGLQLIDSTDGTSALVVEEGRDGLQHFESRRPLPYGN